MHGLTTTERGPKKDSQNFVKQRAHGTPQQAGGAHAMGGADTAHPRELERFVLVTSASYSSLTKLVLDVKNGVPYAKFHLNLISEFHFCELWFSRGSRVGSEA